jgi:hypothetical protein
MKQDFPAALTWTANFARRAVYFAGWLARRKSTTLADVILNNVFSGFSWTCEFRPRGTPAAKHNL